ncbi:MAG: hypothetical protein PGN13_04460 [Patulibacter minatonensis]
MSMRSTVGARRAAAVAAIAAATVVAGCGSGTGTPSANAGGRGSTAAQGGAPQDRAPGQGGPGAMFDTAALAEKLGVSESKLETALQESRPSRGAGQSPDGTPPTSPPQGSSGSGMDDMFATLAAKLGVSESKVRAAFRSAMPQGGPPNGGQAPGGSGSSSSSSSSSSGTQS